MLKTRIFLLLMFALLFSYTFSGAEDVEDRILTFRKLYNTNISEAFKAITPVDHPDIVDEIAKVYKEKSGSYIFADNAMKTAKGEEVIEQILSYITPHGNIECVRVAFISVLANIKPPAAKELLLKLIIREKSEPVQLEMVRTLKWYPCNEVYDAMFVVVNKGNSEKIKAEAVRVLGYYKNEKTAKLLKAVFYKTRLSDDVRGEALYGLSQSKKIDLKEIVAYALREKAKQILLTAIDMAGNLDYKHHAEEIIDFKPDREWQIRQAAIVASGKLNLVAAVPVLIKQWKKEKGRLGDDIHKALLKITGKSFGPDYRYWEAWYENLEEPLEETEREGHYVSYHGTTTRSKNICFCIDNSGSMSSKCKTTRKDYATGKMVEVEITRMEMVKEELIKVIQGLEKNTYFNIISFETAIKMWRKGQTIANNANCTAAVSWIKTLQPTGGTNLYDALVAALGEDSSNYLMAPDTIFLLSDGSPNLQNFKDQDEMLADIARRNRTHRVQIHCIGVGNAGAAFLQKLAEQNNGKYVTVGK